MTVSLHPRRVIIVTAMFLVFSFPLFAQTNGAFFAGAAAQPADSIIQVSDQKAGSFIVFPFYGSDGSSANDTRLTLTNVGPAGLPTGVGAPGLGTATEVLNNLNVHLFWIDATCSVADGFVSFTKFQSWTFKASEWDPVTKTGYMIAVAVDPAGYPISYNGLIGSGFVNCNVTQSGITERWIGSYGAAAFASLGLSILAVPNAQTVYFYTTARTPNSPGTSAQLQFTDAPRFADQGYDAVPNAFAAEFQSTNDAVGQTILTVALQGLPGSSLGGTAVENNKIGVIYRDDEKIFSWTGPGDTCLQLMRLTDNFPRISGKLGNQIRSGRSGTMIWTVESTNAALIVQRNFTGGAVGLFITPRAGNNNWVGIRTLHTQGTGFSRMTLPIFAPTGVL